MTPMQNRTVGECAPRGPAKKHRLFLSGFRTKFWNITFFVVVTFVVCIAYYHLWKQATLGEALWMGSIYIVAFGIAELCD